MRATIFRFCKQRRKPYRDYLSILHNQILPRIGRVPCEIDLSPFKKSNTLFILGCGHSINRIQSEQWREICSADSFGFNLWLYHDHVPTYYMAEFLLPKDHLFARLVDQLQQLRLNSYKNTAIILKDHKKLVNYPEVLDHTPFLRLPHVVVPYSREIKGKDSSSFAFALRLMDWAGVFSSKDPVWFWPTKRGSVVSAVLFALRAGYRKIVLCGIDLNSPYYFFRSRAYRESNLPQLPPPEQEPEFAARLAHYYAIPDEAMQKLPAAHDHPSLRPEAGNLTVPEALAVVDDVLARPRGVNIFTAFSSSALYPRFPCLWG
jgi:hypothetical protein